LFDIFIKALIRAEVRFISRFVLQRSHEERLTGNLVSEIDAALFMAKPVFHEAAVARYGVPKEIDFYYYDLSRGGRIEKQTGADLGFIVVVDLPDHPHIVRSVVLQAKKCDGNPSIDLPQLRTMTRKWPRGSGYLFYDMKFTRLVSPLVLETTDGLLGKLLEDAEKTPQTTGTLDFDKIMDQGTPLSLYLFSEVVEKGTGETHSSFEQAFESFRWSYRQQRAEEPEEFNGRVGIVSLGRAITVGVNNDGGVTVTV